MPHLQITQLPLDESARDDVLALAERAAAHDGAAPLPEQAVLALRRPGSGHSAHVLIRAAEGADLLGYAQVDVAGGKPYATEILVDPDRRRGGLGTVLLTAARTLPVDGETLGPAHEGAPAHPVAVWSHGDLPQARAFAAARRLHRHRDLHVMARPVAHGDAAALEGDEFAAEGLRLDRFRPGADEEAWVRVNAAAFADHPEQGRMGVEDLRERQAEDWFDPTRLYLVREAGGAEEGAAGDAQNAGADPLAFLWMKQESGEQDAELYVLGVHPEAQGRGLGGRLTRVALADAARHGAARTILYVDGDNAAAIATYQRAGFEIERTEAQYLG